MSADRYDPETASEDIRPPHRIPDKGPKQAPKFPRWGWLLVVAAGLIALAVKCGRVGP